jgi:hypothetical protein
MFNVVLKTLNVFVFFAGVSLMLYFVFSDSYVGSNGMLVENFWSWGLGVLFVVVSMVGFTVWGVLTVYRKINLR